MIVELDGIKWKRVEESPSQIVWMAKDGTVAPPEIHRKLDRLAYQIEYGLKPSGRPRTKSERALTIFDRLRVEGHLPYWAERKAAEEVGCSRRTVRRARQARGDVIERN